MAVKTFDELRDEITEKVQFLASFRVNRVATGDGNDYTADVDDHVIAGDTTSSTLTVTLPTAALEEGKVYVITDEGGNAGTNNITVATEGSANVNGSSTDALATNYGSLRLYSDGSDWYTA